MRWWIVNSASSSRSDRRLVVDVGQAVLDDLLGGATVMGYEVSPDPMPEEVSFIRSDQYSFVLKGVSAVEVEDAVKSTDPKIR
jgi:hypothetical protein